MPKCIEPLASGATRARGRLQPFPHSTKPSTLFRLTRKRTWCSLVHTGLKTFQHPMQLKRCSIFCISGAQTKPTLCTIAVLWDYEKSDRIYHVCNDKSIVCFQDRSNSISVASVFAHVQKAAGHLVLKFGFLQLSSFIRGTLLKGKTFCPRRLVSELAELKAKAKDPLNKTFDIKKDWKTRCALLSAEDLKALKSLAHREQNIA